jgi:hypothetical protein
VSLDALSCVVQEFFRGIATLSCGTPHYSNSILDSVANRSCGAGSLVSRLGDMFSSFFQYRGRHGPLLHGFRASFDLASFTSHHY